MLDAPRQLLKGKPGAVGLVKYAWHTAAEISNFVITAAPGSHPRRYTLGGTVVASNPTWLASSPLTFFVPTRGDAMRFPIESWTVTDDRVVARLGALERD